MSLCMVFKEHSSKFFIKLIILFAYSFLKVIYSSKSKHSSRIVFVGLGNHGFTLLAFFVTVIAKQKIGVVIDPSTKSKTLASKVLNCKHYTDIESALQAGEFHGDIVYIASDHLSHTPHTCIAADNFAKMYVEKPLFVNEEQMHDFKKVIYNSVIYIQGLIGLTLRYLRILLII